MAVEKSEPGPAGGDANRAAMMIRGMASERSGGSLLPCARSEAGK